MLAPVSICFLTQEDLSSNLGTKIMKFSTSIKEYLLDKAWQVFRLSHSMKKKLRSMRLSGEVLYVQRVSK